MAEKKQETGPTIWDLLSETNPKYTKNFNRGGYSGTAISPMYSYLRMTEVFGPCGIGWKYEVVNSETVTSPTTDIMIYKEVKLYIKHDGKWSEPITGYGGEYLVRKTQNGLKVDDEAHKKALTDALTNAMKMLGMSADIHLGMFDDNKYVNTLKEKYADKQEEETGSQSKGPDWKAISNDLWNRVNECEDYGSLTIIQDEIAHDWQDAPGSWFDPVFTEIETKAAQLKDGIIEKKPHQFSGTTEAWNWFVSHGSELSAIKSLDGAIDWETRNAHYVEGLSLLDKAEKYKKDGKNPRERIAAQLAHIKGVYHQQPKANGAAAH